METSVEKFIQEVPATGRGGIDKRDVSEGKANSLVRNADGDHQEDNKRRSGSSSVFSVRIPGLQLEALINKLQKMVDELKAARFGSHSNPARKSLPNKQ